MKNRSVCLKVLTILVLVLIFLSRMPGLMHNSALHTDERVFFLSAQSLSRFLLGQSSAYNTVKFYPEGGFTLHMPFQLAAILLGIPEQEHAAARIAGCTYFLLGAILGLCLLQKYFTKSKTASAIYLLTLAFGLIHVEQSRYGTGDTASFLFLMALLLYSCKAMESGRMRHFLIAALFGGCMAAIKYPLAFFLLIPYLGFRKTFAGSEKKVIAKNTWKAALFFFIGFLLLSPKTLTDPTYLFWSCAHETHNYMAGTNITETGGPLNHLFYTTVYTLLYAGLPLIGIGAIWNAGKALLPSRKSEGTDYLLGFALPLTAGCFFVYNLFVTAVFMRTYYPFFCILDLYCAVYCANLVKQKGIKRIAVIAVCAFTVLRGGYLLGIMGTDNGTASMLKIMDTVERNDYTYITELKPGFMAFPDSDLPMSVVAEDLKERASGEKGLKLEEGELLISDWLEYASGTPYLLPITNHRAKEYIALWCEFRDVNAPYRIGMLYPDYYYTLFGFWVKGATGAYFEFPANVFYLNPIQ